MSETQNALCGVVLSMLLVTSVLVAPVVAASPGGASAAHDSDVQSTYQPGGTVLSADTVGCEWVNNGDSGGDLSIDGVTVECNLLSPDFQIGDLDIAAGAGVDGAVEIAGDLTLSGPSNITGDTTVGGDTDLGTGSTVGGDLVGEGGVDVATGTEIAGSVRAGEDADLGTGVTVAGDLTTEGDLSIATEASVAGGIEAVGDADLETNVSVAGGLSSGGDIDLDGSTVAGSLAGQGDGSLSLVDSTVDGLVSGFGDVDIGKSTVDGRLLSSGDVDLQDSTVTGDVYVGGDFSCQNSTVAGEDCTDYDPLSPSDVPAYLDESGTSLPDVDADSPTVFLQQARGTVASLSNPGDLESTAIAALNSSLQNYRQGFFADSAAAFTFQVDALTAIEQLNEQRPADLGPTQQRVVSASNLSARLAVVQAESVVRQYSSELDPARRLRAQLALQRGVSALDAAETAAGTAAIAQYRVAWVAAQRAVDGVDDGIEPTVSVAQEQTVRSGDTVEATFRLEISDIRAYAYETATVTIADEERSVPLRGGNVPGQAAFGTVNVTFDGDLPETVSAQVAATRERTSIDRELVVALEDRRVSREAPDSGPVTVEDDRGVSVTVTGDEVSPGDIRLSDQTPAEDESFRVSPAVRITNRTAFDSADVTLPLGDDADLDENLSIYSWDPADPTGWKPVETEIDPDERTASATVDSFSYFSVFRIDNWQDLTEDTIELEDRYVRGSLENISDGNDTSIELIDLMFVMDVSGSMSGDRIQFAKISSKRFVGALKDDEQAGVSAFASGASLVQPLTTDHDAVNSTIDGLSTGGFTNTAAGLQTGLSELTANGLENRTPVMILLADGGTNTGGDPVDVAADAAAQGVEVNTIGLGSGIDKQELQAIADTGNGDFFQAENAEELPEVFDRVAEETTGPELIDSNGDGLADVFAEMDLRMPSGEPGVVGEPIDLDMTALDTSGDGIRDNETVDIGFRLLEEDDTVKIRAGVTSAEHNPSKRDTTGNGLPDRLQTDGWEIDVVDDHDTAIEMFDAFLDDSDDREPAEFFETREVTSNPLVSATDDDGLNDSREFEVGTDPQRADTTGDGIDDAAAIDAESEDPTIFTTTPPVARLTYYNQWSELSGPGPINVVPEWYFRYQFQIDDEVDIAEYELEREGSTIDEGTPFDTFVFEDVTVQDFWEGVFTSLRGSQSRMYVEDVHGNSQTTLLYSQSSFYGERIADLPLLGPEHAGMLSGFTHSAAGTWELVESLLSSPGDSGDAVIDFMSKLDSGTAADVITGIPGTIQTQQRLDNQFSPDSATQGCEEGDSPDDLVGAIASPGSMSGSLTDCQKYAAGFYAGYVTHTVASLFYGGPITKGATKTVDAASRLSSISVDASRITRNVGTRTRIVSDQVARGGDYNSIVRAVTESSRASGASVRLQRGLDALDAGTQQKLLDFGNFDQTRLFLQRAGEDGATLLNKLDDVAVKDVITTQKQLPQGLRSPYARLSGTYGEDFTKYVNVQNTLQKDAAVRTLNRMPDSAQARFLDDSTSKSLVNLAQNDPVTGAKAAALYRGNSRVIGFGDEPSAKAVAQVANRYDVDDVFRAFDLGGSTTVAITYTGISDFIEALSNGFEAVEPFLKEAIEQGQDNIEPGQQFTVDPAELSTEFDIDAEQIVFELDDDGQVVSTDIVSDEGED